MNDNEPEEEIAILEEEIIKKVQSIKSKERLIYLYTFINKILEK